MISLRRRGHGAAWPTALVLLAILLVIIAVAWWSSTTMLQSRLYPYGFVLALVSPLVSRALVSAL